MHRAAPLLVLALALASVAVGCGSEGTGRALPETVQGKVAQPKTPKGNAAAGKKVFAAQGCGGCHTFKAAGSNGTIGPNLDKGLKGKSADFIHESIVDPNAEITAGYKPNVMPQTYGSTLNDKQLADLVAFLQK
jgi:mono/diheme cytochrome c family protein